MEGAVLAMAITIMTAGARRTCRAVKQDPGNGRERRVGSRNVRRLRPGRGGGRQRRNGRGMGTGTGTGTGMGKGKVLLNKP